APARYFSQFELSIMSSRFVCDAGDDSDEYYYESDSDDDYCGRLVPQQHGVASSSSWQSRLAYVPKYRGGFSGAGITRVDDSTTKQPTSRAGVSADEMRAARERARNLLSDLDESARRTAYAEPISRDWMQEAEGWRRQLENQAIGVDNLPELRRALRRCFDSVGSPWTAAWCLADSGCRVPNSGRKKKSQQKQQFGQPGSFELVCVSELIDWQRERRQSGRALPVWLKQLAFCLGYRGGLQFFCLVGDAFQLTERPVAQSFLVVIRRLIELHLYKEAAQVSCY
uniref:CRAL-TRIO domain-containing protein n=2 Tax=Macrostomum lignano TaxID=282301 RepID=A0A1I8I5U6_9PLAT